MRNRESRSEARALAALAIPVVIDQLGIMSMGLVDTILVGRLGARELAAVGTGTALWYFLMTFAYGLVSGTSAVVAHSFGARDWAAIGRAVGQTMWISIALWIVGLIYISSSRPILVALGQPADVIPLTTAYLNALAWGMLGNLLYATLRAFTVGLGRTRVTMVISIVAAVLNLALAWSLIYGHLGLPALGVVGAGTATAIVHWVSFLLLLSYVLGSRDFAVYRVWSALRPIAAEIVSMLRLGTPIGVAQTLEMAIFGLTTMLMGRIGTIAIASHQIAINVAATLFMVPMGVSIATTTRVGQFAGAGLMHEAARAGWTGVGLSVGFMAITALGLLLLHDPIAALYTNDPAVIAGAGTLLMIAGAFQLSDGLQVSALGALRGLKDTTRPMIVNVISYWLVALPTGWFLGFFLDLGGPGLWWGLTLGLTAAGIMHSLRFRRLASWEPGKAATYHPPSQ